jgi:hypothetical protein
VIFEAIVNLFAALFAGVGDLFGTLSLPSGFGSVGGSLTSIAGYASGLGHLLPFTDAINAVAFVVYCLGLGLAIKVIRIVVSLFTAGGGSAA